MKNFFFCSIVAVTASLAQHAPPIQSPDVHSDGRVTFRFRDRNAQRVVVNREGADGPLVMERDSDGVWTATTTALQPDLYGYSFDADGVRLLDPSNHVIIPNLLSPSSQLHVPGATSLPWEMSDTPHGIVHRHFYKSNVVGDNRDYYVYTPPGYDAKGSTKYPVLYLLHGYSDDASAWTAVGRADLILDSLIAQNQAKPMIIVMPLGYGAPEILRQTAASPSPFNDAALRDRNFDKFRAALIDEVIPAVERTYTVNASRDFRAVAGLSMGGSESLLCGLNRRDKFSWIGAFSSGGLSDSFDSDFPHLDSSANAQLHLLWVACGRGDRLIALNRNLVAWLKNKDVRVTAIETPGMHAWRVWRRNLIAFTPLLFRQAAGNPSATARSKK